MARALSFHEILQQTLAQDQKPSLEFADNSRSHASAAEFPFFKIVLPEWQSPRPKVPYPQNRRSRFHRKVQPQRETRRVSWSLLTPVQRAAYTFLFGEIEPKDVREDEISRCYRRQALACHPDRPAGDAEAFRRLQQNYQILRAAFTSQK
jgi:hypothetical protein